MAWAVAAAAVVYSVQSVPPRPESSFDRGPEGWAVAGSGLRGRAGFETDDTRGGFLVATDPEREATRVVLDIVVAFDTSGSMGPSIDAVRQQTIRIIETLRTNSDDVRLGLVSFGLGVGDVLPLSADLDSRFEHMRSWQAEGGNDPGEDQFMALAEAVGMDWRQDTRRGGGVTRTIIVVTDAPPQKPDVNKNTLEGIAQAVVAAGVHVYPIIVEGRRDALEAGEAIAALTRGKAFPASSGAQVADALLQSINTAIEQGDPWMWEAPAGFRRALSRGYGGTLSFDLRHSCEGELFPADDVVLAGRDFGLVFALPVESSTDWQHFDGPLDEAAGWKKRATESNATVAELVAVLGTLRSLRIRGEYCGGPDSGALDNVAIVEPGSEP